ncbi:MAG TPA: F0F1 ATP synthase subunit B [Gemmatimonadales bacterium]|nr:F0F1 ATP synthase subunit B [Gemmatimonadales bacterium]
MTKSLWLALLALTAATPAFAQEGAEHAAPNPLTPEFGLMFWTIVVFVLLLVILGKFAWPQILGAVEAREQALEAQLAQAQKDREEAAALLAEHKKLVADARGQAHQIVADAHALAERERAVAMEKLKEEQEAYLARARSEIQAERERAVQELRREAVELSLAAATKLVGARLDGDADRRIVTDYLASLEGQH